jgi:hypothetical protein
MRLLIKRQSHSHNNSLLNSSNKCLPHHYSNRHNLTFSIIFLNNQKQNLRLKIMICCLGGLRRKRQSHNQNRIHMGFTQETCSIMKKNLRKSMNQQTTSWVAYPTLILETSVNNSQKNLPPVLKPHNPEQMKSKPSLLAKKPNVTNGMTPACASSKASTTGSALHLRAQPLATWLQRRITSRCCCVRFTQFYGRGILGR